MFTKDIYDSMRKTHYGTFPYSISSGKSRCRYESPGHFSHEILPDARECARIVSVLLILPHRQSCSADAVSHASLAETQYELKTESATQSACGEKSRARGHDVFT